MIFRTWDTQNIIFKKLNTHFSAVCILTKILKKTGKEKKSTFIFSLKYRNLKKIHYLEIIELQVYVSTDDSNQNIKDTFEESLAKVKSNITGRKEIIMIENYNAKTISKQNDSIIKRFGKKIVNDNGNRLIRLC